MNFKKFPFWNVFFTFFILNTSELYTQSVYKTFKELLNEDSTDINTIAIYSQGIRENIFKVSTHPEGIVKLDVIQRKSNGAFTKQIAALSKEEQLKMWNVSRYDNLIQQLAQTDTQETNLKTVLAQFPPEIHKDAVFLATHYRNILMAVNEVYQDFNTSFLVIVSAYVTEDQKAFRILLNAPEALSLLNQNLQMTIRLGEIYKMDPAFLTTQFDSLNLLIAEQQAKESEEWKQQIKNNPEAQEELKQNAIEYSKELGYDDKVYNNEDPDVIAHYVYTPYPYWCGVPWWYEPDYWYPYPYWYHWGFYYHQNNIIWLSPPSWYFIRWHFKHEKNFYYYPHLTNEFFNHYYFGPRRPASRHRLQVRNWMVENDKIVPRDFENDKKQRVTRIQEFGKVEVDRERYNRANPRNPLSKEDYIKRHPAVSPQRNHAGEPKLQNKPKINPVPKRRNEPPVIMPRKEKNKYTAPSQSTPPGRESDRVKPKANPKPIPNKPDKKQSIPNPRIGQSLKPPAIPNNGPLKPSKPKRE